MIPIIYYEDNQGIPDFVLRNSLDGWIGHYMWCVKNEGKTVTFTKDVTVSPLGNLLTHSTSNIHLYTFHVLEIGTTTGKKQRKYREGNVKR
jgi:hypothetical protein